MRQLPLLLRLLLPLSLPVLGKLLALALASQVVGRGDVLLEEGVVHHILHVLWRQGRVLHLGRGTSGGRDGAG